MTLKWRWLGIDFDILRFESKTLWLSSEVSSGLF